MSLMWAMPSATVQKITGAITILISLMKASPSGFSAAPISGHSAPTSTPSAMPISTWIYKCPQQASCHGDPLLTRAPGLCSEQYAEAYFTALR